jgi:sulfate/thiosulfate transport system permease protein
MSSGYRTLGSGWVRWLLILAGVISSFVILILPLILILTVVVKAGAGALVVHLADSDMRSALKLTLLVTLITVPVNVFFGTALAWCVTRFSFTGRRLLMALIDTPFALSPVIAGLSYLLLYGLQSSLGGWLDERGIQIMFAAPGIVLVTIFVTAPYVARELIPLMQSQGQDQEEAAMMLGAGGWQLFWQVTLPNIKWGLWYGAVLTSARAAGEFGSVSVVSGMIRGQTNTLPLHVDLLHQDYNTVGAFTAAAMLAGIALIAMVLKVFLEWCQGGHAQASNKG